MVIEKGIAIPKAQKATEAVETARKMEPGDSVLCNCEREAYNVCSALRRQGGKSSVRKLREGWRVWRTA